MEIWRKARGTKGSLKNHQYSRVFLVKILQHDFLHRRSSRCRNINLQNLLKHKSQFSTNKVNFSLGTVLTHFKHVKNPFKSPTHPQLPNHPTTLNVVLRTTLFALKVFQALARQRTGGPHGGYQADS